MERASATSATVQSSGSSSLVPSSDAGVAALSAGAGENQMGWSGMLCPNEYQSVKFVRVKNRGLASIHRLIFILCLGYVIGYQIIWGKGYQKQDLFSSALDIKVKGVASVAKQNNKSEIQVFDAIDLVRPALEESAVFIQTNVWETKRQHRGICAGVDLHDPPSPPAQASERCECSNGECSCVAGLHTANGVTTGRCIDTNTSEIMPGQMISNRGLGYMCELEAWCPVELEGGQDGQGNLELAQVGNFTMFVRIDGRFTELAPSETFSNFADGELKWNSNLFYLSDLVAAAATGATLQVSPVNGPDGIPAAPPQRLPQEHFERIVRKGGELVVDYMWECNLDRENGCTTKLRVHRIDQGKGFNYRSAEEYRDPDTKELARDLAKRYGLRVVFRVMGKGGKFDAVTLGVVLGSGLGLLGIATVIADFLLSSKKSMRVFQKAKYESVSESRGIQAEDDSTDVFQVAPLSNNDHSTDRDTLESSSREPLLSVNMLR